MMHVPVMLEPIMDVVAPLEGKTILDGTFGGGGYTRVFLEKGASRVVAVDRDPDAVARAASFEKAFGARFSIYHGVFTDMAKAVAAAGLEKVDAVVLDLGVSSFQLDEDERGFSFKKDGPLDMRMSQAGVSAADVVRDTEESKLADILYIYGEERQSRRVAKAIVLARQEAPIVTTQRLADIVARAIGGGTFGKRHPAMRTFLALRLYVNRELEQVSDVLPEALSLLHENGKLCVVTFHSLEDRIVKQFMHKFPKKAVRIGDVWQDAPEKIKNVRVCQPVRKGIKPSDAEVAGNPRARSAMLRYLEVVA